MTLLSHDHLVDEEACPSSKISMLEFVLECYLDPKIRNIESRQIILTMLQGPLANEQKLRVMNVSMKMLKLSLEQS